MSVLETLGLEHAHPLDLPPPAELVGTKAPTWPAGQQVLLLLSSNQWRSVVVPLGGLVVATMPFVFPFPLHGT